MASAHIARTPAGTPRRTGATVAMAEVRQSRFRLANFFGLAFGILLLALLLAPEAEAAHFRGGHFNWIATGNGNEIELGGWQSWTGSGSCVTSLSPGAVCTTESVINWGDGTSVPFALRITVSSSAAGYIAGDFVATDGSPLRHVYASPNNNGQPWEVSWGTCCRISGVTNSPEGGAMTILTSVDLAAASGSPRSALPPVLECQAGTECRIVVPSTQPDGEPVTLRFADTGELGSTYTIPSSGGHTASLTGSTFAWNTAGVTNPPKLFALQFIQETGSNRASQDVLLRVVSDLTQRPVFDTPPSPCGTIRPVDKGATETFTLQSSSPVGSTVTVFSLGLPTEGSASLTGTPGNPASYTFSWTTPTEPRLNPFVSFISIDAAGRQSEACLVGFTFEGLAGAPDIGTPVPAISGPTKNGETLTADPGTWNGNPELSIQWQRCDAEGEACVDIVGETGETYTLGDDDVGKTIRVVVTATNEEGEPEATSETVGPIVSEGGINTAAPTLSGDARDGGIIDLDPGVWIGHPVPTLSQQWQRCDRDGDNCVAIPGATNTDYQPTEGDDGHTLRVLVKGTNEHGETSVSTEPTEMVGGLIGLDISSPGLHGQEGWVQTDSPFDVTFTLSNRGGMPAHGTGFSFPLPPGIDVAGELPFGCSTEEVDGVTLLSCTAEYEIQADGSLSWVISLTSATPGVQDLPVTLHSALEEIAQDPRLFPITTFGTSTLLEPTLTLVEEFVAPEYPFTLEAKVQNEGPDDALRTAFVFTYPEDVEPLDKYLQLDSTGALPSDGCWLLESEWMGISPPALVCFNTIGANKEESKTVQFITDEPVEGLEFGLHILDLSQEPPAETTTSLEMDVLVDTDGDGVPDEFDCAPLDAAFATHCQTRTGSTTLRPTGINPDDPLYSKTCTGMGAYSGETSFIEDVFAFPFTAIREVGGESVTYTLKEGCNLGYLYLDLVMTPDESIPDGASITGGTYEIVYGVDNGVNTHGWAGLHNKDWSLYDEFFNTPYADDNLPYEARTGDLLHALGAPYQQMYVAIDAQHDGAGSSQTWDAVLVHLEWLLAKGCPAFADPTTCDPLRVVRIELEPGEQDLTAGATGKVSPTAYNELGEIVEDAEFTYRLKAPATYKNVRLNDDGTFTLRQCLDDACATPIVIVVESDGVTTEFTIQPGQGVPAGLDIQPGVIIIDPDGDAPIPNVVLIDAHGNPLDTPDGGVLTWSIEPAGQGVTVDEEGKVVLDHEGGFATGWYFLVATIVVDDETTITEKIPVFVGSHPKFTHDRPEGELAGDDTMPDEVKPFEKVDKIDSQQRHTYGVFIHEAEPGAKVRVTPDPTKERDSGASGILRDAVMTINPDAEGNLGGIIIQVRTIMADADDAPDQVVRRHLRDQLAAKHNAVLFVEVSGIKTENGDPLTNAELNAAVGSLDTVLCLPRSHFTQNGLDPQIAKLLQYHDPDTGDPVFVKEIALGVPVSKTCGWEYTVHLDSFSVFGLVAGPASSGGGGGGGGGGGSLPSSNTGADTGAGTTSDGAAGDGGADGDADGAADGQDGDGLEGHEASTSDGNPGDGTGSEGSDSSASGIATGWKMAGLLALLLAGLLIFGFRRTKSWWFILGKRRKDDEEEEDGKV